MVIFPVNKRNCVTRHALELSHGQSAMAFHEAVLKGDIKNLERLLSMGFNIDSLDSHKHTPLYLAVKKNNAPIVELLLKHEANVSISYGGKSIFHCAVENRHKDIVKLLLEIGNYVDVKNDDGESLLCFAVKVGVVPIVELILKFHPDVNDEANRRALLVSLIEEDKSYLLITQLLVNYGFSVKVEDCNDGKLVHATIKKGNVSILESLIKHGLKPNSEYLLKEDWTVHMPLHTAAGCKQGGIVKLLLENGADVNKGDINGKCAIFYCIENYDPEIFQLLFTKTEESNLNLLQYAIKAGSILAFQFLFQFVKNINARDVRGNALLHYVNLNVYNQPARHYPSSIMTNKKSMADILLKAGAHVDARNKRGFTAIHKASRYGYSEIVDVLVKHDAEINARCHRGLTPLHLACHNLRDDVVVKLLDFGADMSVVSDDKKTPLQVLMALFDKPRDNMRPKVSTICYFGRHLLKLKHARGRISWGMSSMTISVSDNIEEAIKKEIKAIKDEKLDGTNISLHKILLMNTKQLALYLKHIDIEEGSLKLENIYRKKFPLYFGMLHYYFRRAKKRSQLTDQATLILPKIFKGMTYDAIDIILGYLDNSDLRALLEAYEISEKYSTPSSDAN